jgi:hypothetical protein
MSTDQEPLFQTPAEEREAESKKWVDYLLTLTCCPHCGRPESGIWALGNNHGLFTRHPNYLDGAGCTRLHLLGSQTRSAIARDDNSYHWYVEAIRYKDAATMWPQAWEDALLADVEAANA